MSKEDKHAHDKFRKDALKAIKEGRLEKAKHFYEAAIGNCAYISTMLELADLYLKMGMHQKEAKDLATRVLLVPDVKASQQKHATKILHQLLPPASASPPASGPMVFGAAAAAAAASGSPAPPQRAAPVAPPPPADPWAQDSGPPQTEEAQFAELLRTLGLPTDKHEAMMRMPPDKKREMLQMYALHQRHSSVSLVAAKPEPAKAETAAAQQQAQAGPVAHVAGAAQAKDPWARAEPGAAQAVAEAEPTAAAELPDGWTEHFT
eukprot:Transcript_14752.p1 GENE.Transcript_14752~~Transcript_14752.p1  ORF type:complete len:263 (+),score=97.71 Transcript_14752:323-1111(+)